ncbi:hypothetical protein ACLUEY_00360 [Vreelandella aquamarina]
MNGGSEEWVIFRTIIASLISFLQRSSRHLAAAFLPFPLKFNAFLGFDALVFEDRARSAISRFAHVAGERHGEDNIQASDVCALLALGSSPPRLSVQKSL